MNGKLFLPVVNMRKGETSLSRVVTILFVTFISFFSGLIDPTWILSQPPPHEKIVLKGFDGSPLTVNSKTPYSPKKTCGVCHDYDRITNGYHFQQGRTDGMGKIVIER